MMADGEQVRLGAVRETLFIPLADFADTGLLGEQMVAASVLDEGWLHWASTSSSPPPSPGRRRT